MISFKPLIYCALAAAVLVSCSDSHPTQKEKTPYSAIARAKVDIEGGLINIAAPAEAIFSQVNVKVGDKVNAGDLLATLNSEEANLDLSLATAESHHAQAELAGLNSRVAAAQNLAKRWQTAVKAGAAEQQQADEAAQALAQLQAEIATAKSAVEMASIKQQQAQLAVTQRKLKAPVAGEIIKVYAQKGASLGGNRPAALVLLPEQPLLIRAEVNESFITRLRVGTKATVTLESSPDTAPLEAHVVRIGKLLEQGQFGEEPQTGRFIECILAFEQPQHLFVGQNLMVKFYEQH